MTTSSFDPSVYRAEEALLDLADHYLEPGSYSTLRSGLLGYMTASMARVAAEGAYHRDVLYRENFLNTASMPRSIYNFAKVYDYAVGTATPASCRALVGFYLDEIRLAIGGETGVLTIPRGQPFYLGSAPFMVAGRVDLTVLERGRVTAEYDPTDIDFLPPGGSTYVRTYLTPQVVSSDGAVRTVVYLEVHLHQATPRVADFQVVSGSALESSFYQVQLPAGEQLSRFRVLYRGPTDTAARELKAVFNETSAPDASEFCFYSFSGGGQLEIYFSTLPNLFRPAFNSTLTVEYITTTGSAGNFTFTGVATMPLASQRGLATLVEMVTQPAGGRNMESLVQVKQGILRKILQRRSIIIESDLADYLSGAVDRTSVNGSRLQFVKRRDDMQSRLFRSFLQVYDSQGRVVPTNTVALDIEAADLEARGWSLRPGDIVVHDARQGLFRLIGPGEYPDRMANDPSSFVYCVPFLMEFRVAPFPRLVYYQNSVAIDAQLSGLAGGYVVADSFLAGSASVRRNAALEDAYQIDLPVSSGLDNATLRRTALVRVRFFGEGGEDYGYAEAEHVDGTNIFRALVRTGDSFDAASRLLLTDSIWSPEGTGLMAHAPVPEGIRLRFELFYSSGSSDTTAAFVERDGSIFQLVQSFETVDSLSLYRSLERVVSSEMHVTSEGTFHCDAVPVVGASFFLNPPLGAEVLRVAGSYHSAVLDVFDLLHNNTTVDVKFFNTYGPSLLFNLDRVNISLALEVRPRGRATEDLRQRIVRAAAAFVAACNDNDGSRFSISNLTTRLETTFSEIAFVRFVSLNGVSSQNAEFIYTARALEQNNRRVPEFLNVATTLRSSLDQDPYVPDVAVTFI